MHLLSMSCFWVFALSIVAANDGSHGEDNNVDLMYQTPILPSDAYFVETFDDPAQFDAVWSKSESLKNLSDGTVSKYDGEWRIEASIKDPLPGDLGLVLKTKDKLAAISAPLNRPFEFNSSPLVLQYEVLFQDGQACGGAYLKLLSADSKLDENLASFHDKTPYTIMFGPDKCGSDHNLHFIFRHKNPINGSFEEKHCKKPKERIDDNFNDRKPHLYTLVVNPDNTFQIFVDHQLVNNGSLLADFTPAVNPPPEIDDPSDRKPLDWDDREKIPDTSVSKPDDWNENAPEKIPDNSVKMPEGWLEDEPTHIPDPLAEKPADWDNSMDGEWDAPLVQNPVCEEAPGCGKWEPPMIRNPDYKGKWTPPLVDNPNYRGKWKPKRIKNPDYFEDKFPFKMSSIIGVGFELWTTSRNMYFDNIILCDKLELANELSKQTFDLKKRLMELEADTFLNRFITYTNTRPWLWAVYVVVLLIPITLIVILCFGSSSKEKDRLQAEAIRKKTDEPTELDDENSYLDDAETNYLDETMSDNLAETSYLDEPMSDPLAPTTPEGSFLNDTIENDELSMSNSSIHYEEVYCNDLISDNHVSSTQDTSPRRRCQRID